MGKMIDGEWTTQWYGSDEVGHFQREDTVFHRRVGDEEASEHPVASGRYHLYVSWACPWAHRTLIVRTLKGLEAHISVSAVHWYMADDGWTFDESDPDVIPDTVNGERFLREVYRAADAHYTGRVTVPVLWDKEAGTIVNNESPEIMRMLDVDFHGLSTTGVDLYPEGYREQVDEVMDAIYTPINNGVYRAGFADSQQAYDEAVQDLFSALARWEDVLAERRFLCGPCLTEADIAMFTTLVRFDPVYATHFKCNLKRLVEFPNLFNYVKEIYQVPGVADTVNMRHIKHHYYRSHGGINPKGIVAAGFEVDYAGGHDRGRFGDEPILARREAGV